MLSSMWADFFSTKRGLQYTLIIFLITGHALVTLITSSWWDKNVHIVVNNNNNDLSHSYRIWHGADYKIGLRLSVGVSVYLSVCEHSHGRISGSILAKIGADVRTPKSKNEFAGVNIAPPLPLS